MAFDLTQTNATVDQYWRESVQETDETGALFWDRLESKPLKTVNTKGEKWMVRTGYNESEAGTSFDGGSLATPGNSTFANLYVPYRTISSSMQISQEAIDNDDGKSKYHPVIREMASMKMLAYKKLNRHLMMDDGTGRIAVTSDVETGSTVTCAPNTTFGNKGAQFVKHSKTVQIYDATGVSQRTGGGANKLIVSSATKPVLSTGVITFTTAAPTDVIATDIIVPEGMAGRGTNGLGYWVANSGNLFDLSRATHPGLSSTMVDGSSGSLMILVESMSSKMAHYIEEDATLGSKGGSGHEIFWSPTQREKYRKEALGAGMSMLGDSKAESGFGFKETINNLMCTMIKDHDNTKVHFLRMSDWYKVGNNAATPFEPYKVDGNMLYHIRDTTTGGATTYLASTIRAYVNLACENVRSQGAIYSLPTTGLQTGN